MIQLYELTFDGRDHREGLIMRVAAIFSLCVVCAPALQSVLKALRAAGINIVAIHQHMTGEQPRVLFLHYWGVGPTDTLSKGLRAALDKTTGKKAPAR